MNKKEVIEFKIELKLFENYIYSTVQLKITATYVN